MRGSFNSKYKCKNNEYENENEKEIEFQSNDKSSKGRNSFKRLDTI